MLRIEKKMRKTGVTSLSFVLAFLMLISVTGYAMPAASAEKAVFTSVGTENKYAATAKKTTTTKKKRKSYNNSYIQYDKGKCILKSVDLYA